LFGSAPNRAGRRGFPLGRGGIPPPDPSFRRALAWAGEFFGGDLGNSHNLC